MFRSEQEHGQVGQLSTIVARVPYKRLVLFLTAFVAVIVVAGLLADLWFWARPAEWKVRFLEVLWLGEESSIPTWVSTILLLACSVLLAFTAKIATARGMKHTKSWWLLSGIFCLLSLDEIAMLHERSGWFLEAFVPPVRDMGGIFYFSWTVLAIPAVALLALILMRWFFALPWRVRLQFGAAAFIFISGAVGVEMFNSSTADGMVDQSITYVVFNLVEESLELAGLVLFLYALLDNLHRLGASIAISLAPAD